MSGRRIGDDEREQLSKILTLVEGGRMTAREAERAITDGQDEPDPSDEECEDPKSRFYAPMTDPMTGAPDRIQAQGLPTTP